MRPTSVNTRALGVVCLLLSLTASVCAQRNGTAPLAVRVRQSPGACMGVLDLMARVDYGGERPLYGSAMASIHVAEGPAGVISSRPVEYKIQRHMLSAVLPYYCHCSQQTTFDTVALVMGKPLGGIVRFNWSGSYTIPPVSWSGLGAGDGTLKAIISEWPVQRDDTILLTVDLNSRLDHGLGCDDYPNEGFADLLIAHADNYRGGRWQYHRHECALQVALPVTRHEQHDYSLDTLLLWVCDRTEVPHPFVLSASIPITHLPPSTPKRQDVITLAGNARGSDALILDGPPDVTESGSGNLTVEPISGLSTLITSPDANSAIRYELNDGVMRIHYPYHSGDSMGAYRLVFRAMRGSVEHEFRYHVNIAPTRIQFLSRVWHWGTANMLVFLLLLALAAFALGVIFVFRRWRRFGFGSNVPVDSKEPADAAGSEAHADTSGQWSREHDEAHIRSDIPDREMDIRVAEIARALGSLENRLNGELEQVKDELRNQQTTLHRELTALHVMTARTLDSRKSMGSDFGRIWTCFEVVRKRLSEWKKNASSLDP